MSQNFVQNGAVLGILESLMTHPTHADGFVDSGDPLFVGNIIGVAEVSAGAATDVISVARLGVFNLAVVAEDGAGANDAVAIGDTIFISATGILNKGRDGIPFGIALEVVTGGATTTIKVALITDKAGERISVQFNHEAADIARGFFIADRPMKVIEAIHSHETVTSGAAQENIEKCNSGEAPGAGNNVLAAGFDLTSTVDTPVTDPAVATVERFLVDGDLLRGVLASGTITGLADAVTSVVLEYV